MLLLLAGNDELCVCDFERVLEITQSKASRHLRYLLRARLVDDRREGVWVYYRLARDLEPSLRAVLAGAEGALDPSTRVALLDRLEQWRTQKDRDSICATGAGSKVASA